MTSAFTARKSTRAGGTRLHRIGRVNVGFALLTLFPGRVGGSEVYVRALLAAFAEGHGPEHVTVLANRHVAAAYRDDGPVRVHHVRSYRAGDRSLTRALAMASAMVLPGLAARGVPPGLDLVHYPVTVPIPRSRAPAVVTLHDLQHHDLPAFFGRAETAYRRRFYDAAARAATVVITPSEFSKSRIVDALGVDPSRVEVVWHGIDGSRFTPEPAGDESTVEPLGLPERYLLYPANSWPHKNHDRLLEGLSLAPGVALVLSGQGYGRLRALLDRASRLEVADRVTHVGHIPHSSLPALYRSAVGVVFPSLYEGFGAPPLEAMACGCPAAVADAASLPEVTGGAALTFDPRSPRAIADAMERLWEDAPLRAKLREKGLARARTFSWHVAAERHRAIYERAAATSPPAARS